MERRVPSALTIKDKIYGEVSLEDAVIIELLESGPVLRLQKIGQFGVPDKYYHVDGYSRFEHSVGVMLLLRKLGASQEEQVGGLLHDISHTAFSHTIDWVLGEHGAEDFQDNRHAEFIKDPELSEILIKNGLDPKRIFDLKKFKLLDSEIPNLCADRIDYALREFPEKEARFCLESLRVENGRIIFSNKQAAVLFARNFLSLQMDHWGGFEAVSRWHIFAEILKRALGLKIIEFSDFYKDDDFVVSKLEASKDEEIQKQLAALSNRTLANLPKSGEKGHKKFRYVDPEFVSKGRIRRLSEVDRKFVIRLKSMRKANKEGIILPVIE